MERAFWGDGVLYDIQNGANEQIAETLRERETLHNSGYSISKHRGLWVPHFPTGPRMKGGFKSLETAKQFMHNNGVDLTKVLVKNPDSQTGWYAAAYNR
jgi:hypothetical protein